MHKKLICITILIFSSYLLCFSQTENSPAATTNNNENLIDSLKSVMDEYAENRYKINISFNGYEAGNDESWYYDSLGVICGYHTKWDMEGQSGESYNWFENGKLVYLYEETQGNEGEPDIVFLKNPKDFTKLQTYDSESKSQEQKIFNLINENKDSIVEYEFSANLTIEEKVNYGFEFTQTTEVSIDRELYEILFKKD